MCVVFSFASLTMYVLYLPFYKPVMNIASIIHSSVFASATLFMACAEVRGFPEVRTVDCVLEVAALAFGMMAAKAGFGQHLVVSLTPCFFARITARRLGSW
jgi:hypothetical protein